jgi:hypothetical protein
MQKMKNKGKKMLKKSAPIQGADDQADSKNQEDAEERTCSFC